MTLYDDLGIDSAADDDAIRRAFRARAKATHPDANPDDPDAAAKFSKALVAYQTLSDPSRRKRYDETGQTDEPTGPSVSDRARAAIRAAFAAALAEAFADGGDRIFRDLAKEVARRLRNDKAAFMARRREAARTLTREKRLRGRVRGAEFLRELDRMIVESEQQIEVCNQNAAIVDAALAFLADGYAHDPDAPPQEKTPAPGVFTHLWTTMR